MVPYLTLLGIWCGFTHVKHQQKIPVPFSTLAPRLSRPLNTLLLYFNTLALKMWTLFTKALARGHSTTQVSIMNTSSNFVLTAVLGSAVFSEALPPLWWLGASLLVAGNVIIGQKDESGGAGGPQTAAADGFRDDAGATGESPAAEDRFGAYRDAELTDRMLAAQLGRDDDEDVPDLGEAEH